jgi:hypothetical protein
VGISAADQWGITLEVPPRRPGLSEVSLTQTQAGHFCSSCALPRVPIKRHAVLLWPRRFSPSCADCLLRAATQYAACTQGSRPADQVGECRAEAAVGEAADI